VVMLHTPINSNPEISQTRNLVVRTLVDWSLIGKFNAHTSDPSAQTRHEDVDLPGISFLPRS